MKKPVRFLIIGLMSLGVNCGGSDTANPAVDLTTGETARDLDATTPRESTEAHTPDMNIDAGDCQAVCVEGM